MPNHNHFSQLLVNSHNFKNSGVSHYNKQHSIVILVPVLELILEQTGELKLTLKRKNQHRYLQ